MWSLFSWELVWRWWWHRSADTCSSVKLRKEKPPMYLKNKTKHKQHHTVLTIQKYKKIEQSTHMRNKPKGKFCFSQIICKSFGRQDAPSFIAFDEDDGQMKWDHRPRKVWEAKSQLDNMWRFQNGMCWGYREKTLFTNHKKLLFQPRFDEQISPVC